MLSNGSRLREIYEATGMYPAKVSLVAKTYGIKRGVFADVREAVRRVSEGEATVKQASAETGVPEHKIYYALRVQMGVPAPKQAKPSDMSKWDEIAAMKATGATLAEVAAFYGVSRQRIHQVLAKREKYLAQAAKAEQ
jgi:predicted transcriptional regulator